MPYTIHAGKGREATSFPAYTLPEVNRAVLKNAIVDYDYGGALDYDPFIHELDGGGLAGLGAVRKPPEVVTVTAPAPVKMSTVYAVVGLSVLAIGGSIAFWALSKKKRK